MHQVLVRDIMSTPVVTVDPDTLAVDAAQLMEEFEIRRLPVVDEEEYLVGIVTDADVLEAETAEHMLTNYEPDLSAEWLAVQDIMNGDVVTVTADCSVGELAETFMRHKVGGVPVVEHVGRDQQRVIGIVSETDIFRLIAEAWRADRGTLVSTAPASAPVP